MDDIKRALVSTGVSQDLGSVHSDSDAYLGKGGSWTSRRRSLLDAYDEEKFGSKWTAKKYSSKTNTAKSAASARSRSGSLPIGTLEEDENAPLLSSNASGPMPPPYQDEEEEEEYLEDPDAYKKRWRSIRIMYLTTFLSSVGFSIVLSSLSPYLKEIMGNDGPDATNFLGWVVSAFSLGQLVGSPIFGVWSNHRAAIEPLIISLVCAISGNVMYCFGGAFHNGTTGKFFILGARALCGIGAGNVAVCRAYVSGATLLKERTGAMANMSAAQGLGFIIGPALGAAFASLPNSSAHVISFTMSTGPGWMSAFMGVVNVLCVIFWFREYRIATVKTDDDTIEIPAEVKTYDKLAAAAALLDFFMILFVFSIYETIGTPLTADEYGWDPQQQSLYNGIIYGVAGLLAVVTFMAMKPLSVKYGERPMLIVGFILILCGLIVFMPWGPSKTTINCMKNNTYIHEWCADTPAIPFPQFLVAGLFIALGYPTASVIMFSVYSKILGPAPQGFGMGLLTSVGSAARTLGPIVVTYLYTSFGPRVTFGGVAAAVVVCILLTFVNYKRLIPHVVWRSEKGMRGQSINAGGGGH